MPLTNEQRVALLIVKIKKQVDKSAGRGLNAARVFLTARIKEALSVPAPRKAVRAAPLPGQKKGGILYYRAATPATVGAPPRKLSSRLRTSTTSAMLTTNTAVIGSKARGNPTVSRPEGMNYPLYHEQHDHPFIAPTVERWKKELVKICGKAVTLR